MPCLFSAPIASLQHLDARCSPDAASCFSLATFSELHSLREKGETCRILSWKNYTNQPFCQRTIHCCGHSRGWKVSILRDDKAWELRASVSGVRLLWFLSPILLFTSSGLKPTATTSDCAGLSYIRPPSQESSGGWHPTGDVLAKACALPRYFVHQGKGIIL